MFHSEATNSELNLWCTHPRDRVELVEAKEENFYEKKSNNLVRVIYAPFSDRASEESGTYIRTMKTENMSTADGVCCVRDAFS